MNSKTLYEEILNSLVHDLRQPLGNIETSIFYLDLVLARPSVRAREQLRTMEHQVARVTQLLQRAAEDLRSMRTQDSAASTEASFNLTKSASAGVT
jgi:signal transduction histidine kinase